MLEVPFINYRKKLLPYKEIISQLLLDCAHSSEFILKSNVNKFESEFSKKFGFQHVNVLSSGTFALYLALIALGVKKGDEVITPAFSYISTASVIAQLGAVPIFADVDRYNFLMNAESIKSKISHKTKAIIAVHLFSALADMHAIRAVADHSNIALIEDSAVMLGGTINDQLAGTFGDVAIFSFFPAKPLGGLGDGGMIVTNNEKISDQIFQLRNHGQDGKTRFLHHQLGFNSRMDEINAGFLLHKLKSFAKNNHRRKKISAIYHESFKCLSNYVIHQQFNPEESSNYAYVICAKDRNKLREFLTSRGIETKTYYPEILPLQSAFHYLKHSHGDFPNAEHIASHAVALPICETLSDEHIHYVIANIKDFYNGY